MAESGSRRGVPLFLGVSDWAPGISGLAVAGFDHLGVREYLVFEAVHEKREAGDENRNGDDEQSFHVR